MPDWGSVGNHLQSMERWRTYHYMRADYDSWIPCRNGFLQIEILIVSLMVSFSTLFHVPVSCSRFHTSLTILICLRPDPWLADHSNVSFSLKSIKYTHTLISKDFDGLNRSHCWEWTKLGTDVVSLLPARNYVSRRYHWAKPEYDHKD